MYCPVCVLPTSVLWCFTVSVLICSALSVQFFMMEIDPFESQLVHKTITFTVHLLIAGTVYFDSVTSVSLTKLHCGAYRG